MLARGEKLPVDFSDRVIYYVGPVDPVRDEVVGPAGPTTATRMDKFTETMLAKTGLVAMIGKAERGPGAIEAIRKHKAAYLIAVGGAAYLVAKAIRNSRVLAFADLGMLVGVLAGVLSDRYGRRRLALRGLVLLAAGGAMGALAHDFALLLASRFVEGVGFILFAVPAPALMSALSRDARERAKALSLWSAYMPTGGTLALLAAPVFIATASWRALWLALAAAAMLAAFVLARTVPAGAAPRVASLRLVRESLARPGNIAMAFLFASYVAQWTSIMVWLPTFLGEHGASTATAATATALMVL